MTAYESDKDALTAQFDAAEALLKEIQAETTAVKVTVQEQRSHVERVTQDVEAVVKEMHESEIKTREEMREIRSEVTNIHEMLPKVCLVKHCVARGLTRGLDDREEQGSAVAVSRGAATRAQVVEGTPTKPGTCDAFDTVHPQLPRQAVNTCLAIGCGRQAIIDSSGSSPFPRS